MEDDFFTGIPRAPDGFLPRESLDVGLGPSKLVMIVGRDLSGEVVLPV